jgi:predicted flap endonuclease-1-like 5' DNA nuclease
MDYVDKAISERVPSYDQMQPQQQRGFLEEIFDEIGGEIQSEVKDAVKAKFRGESTSPPVEVDEHGRAKVDYGNMFNKVMETLNKYIDKMPSKQPERKRVTPMPPPPIPDSPPPSPPSASPPQEGEASQGDLQEESIEKPPEEPVIEEPVEEQRDRGKPSPGLIHGAGHIAPGGRVPENMPHNGRRVEETPREPVIHSSPTPSQEERIIEEPPEPQIRERGAEYDVKEISGIGPAYSALLREIGITDIRQLADADPSHISEKLDVPESKTVDWNKQAKDRLDTL